MNLANGLTLARIFAVPLIVAVLLTRSNHDDMLLAAVIFLLASATDLLDGYIARKRGQVTTLGILLDPVADKLLISSVFISLVQLGLAPAWMVVIIIGREFAISGLRNIASDQGFTIDASELGKIKMVAQVAAITLLLLKTRYPVLDRPGKFALYVVVIFALWSAVGYFRTFWTKIDDRFKAKERRRLTLVKKRPRRHAPTQ
jgi:CDP-diacylglycerol--glycerol-3-phosphate 3-phosphatidyltransferase